VSRFCCLSQLSDVDPILCHWVNLTDWGQLGLIKADPDSATRRTIWQWQKYDPTVTLFQFKFRRCCKSRSRLDRQGFAGVIGACTIASNAWNPRMRHETPREKSTR
jgi:hypothetical protein